MNVNMLIPDQAPHRAASDTESPRAGGMSEMVTITSPELTRNRAHHHLGQSELF